MASIEAKILRRERNDQGQVEAITGKFGNVVAHARGFGTQHENSKFPILGFPARWESGMGPDITPTQNRLYLAEQIAKAIVVASNSRGFDGRLDMVRIESASAPFGIETEVIRILQEKYGHTIKNSIRDCLACNGTVYGLSQEAGKQSLVERNVAIVAAEHTSPFTQHNPLLRELFADGVGVLAFKSGDVRPVVSNTIFDQDKIQAPVLTLPHSRVGTLPPEGGRKPFIGRGGTCRVVGERGHVFEYQGGMWQPITEAEEATMDGRRLLTYFASTPLGIMEKTLREYEEKQGEKGYGDLNSFGVIHQPSFPVIESIINHISKSDLPLQRHLVGRTEQRERLGFALKGHIDHVWTPNLETTSFLHNNVSGATTIFSLLAMIEAGLITQSDIMFTGMGVGHNMTSTIFRFNELSRIDRVKAKAHLPHRKK